MRRCVALRGRSAIVARRRPSLCHQRRYAHGAEKKDEPILGTSRAASEQPGEEEDGSEPYRVDTENKIVETVVGNLPLSPVMDPTYWAAKERYSKPKAQAAKPSSAEERQFNVNIFARALAEPVRVEPVTRTRQPRFFMQDFELLEHPETGKPWFVPRSLALHDGTSDPSDDAMLEDTETAETLPVDAWEREEGDGDAVSLGTAVEGETQEFEAQEDEISTEKKAISSEEDEVAEGTGATRSEPVEEEDGASITSQTPNAFKKHLDLPAVKGPSVYAPARYDVLAAFNDKKSGYKNYSKALMSETTTRFKKLMSGAVWRTDMADLVLDQMRQRIVQDLLELARLSDEQRRFYIVKCYGWDDVRYKHRGALLWLGPQSEGQREQSNGDAQSIPSSEEHEPERPEQIPGPFATYEYTDTRPAPTPNFDGTMSTDPVTVTLVVHNLPMLLGNKYTEQLKQEARRFQDGVLYMIQGRKTGLLQSRLWKLQCYSVDTKTLLTM